MNTNTNTSQKRYEQIRGKMSPKEIAGYNRSHGIITPPRPRTKIPFIDDNFRGKSL